MEEIVHQVGYLPELYEDARSGKYTKSKIKSFIFLCLMEVRDLCIPVLGFQIVWAFVIKLPASQHQEKRFPSVFSNLYNCNKSIWINTPNTNSIFKILKGQAVQIA